MEVKHQPRSFASAQFSLIITLKSIKVLALEAVWVGSSISFLNCNDLKRAFSCLHSGMDALLAEKSVFRSPRTITSCPSDNAPSNILSNRKLCCLKIRGGGKERSLLMRGSSYSEMMEGMTKMIQFWAAQWIGFRMKGLLGFQK